jgi:acyl carrier protein
VVVEASFSQGGHIWIMAGEPGMALSFDSVFGEVASMLERFRSTDKAITAQTVIAEDLNMDSLQVMDLMMELEEKFDVSIPLNMLPEIATVGQLAQTIVSGRKAA